MKKFIAFVVAVIFLVAGKPMLTRAQEQDTTKGFPPTLDTTGHISLLNDTAAKPVTTPTVTAVAAAEPNPLKMHAVPHKEKKHKKERRNLLYRIHMIGYKKRERERYVNAGHHELYLRPRREQKRMVKHHLNPFKVSKADKKKAKTARKRKEKRSGGKAKEEAEQKTGTEPPKDEAGKPKEETDKLNGGDKPKDETDKGNTGDKPKDETEKPKEPELPKSDAALPKTDSLK